MALVGHDSPTVGRASHSAMESGSFVAGRQLTRETIIYGAGSVMSTFFVGIRGLFLPFVDY